MFKEAIKKELERRERSQAWLARHTNIPEASISIYLRTGVRMSIARVEKIFEFLGITVVGPGNKKSPIPKD
jgi:hypothetical protein